jgi:hypothetical protein
MPTQCDLRKVETARFDDTLIVGADAEIEPSTPSLIPVVQQAFRRYRGESPIPLVPRVECDLATAATDDLADSARYLNKAGTNSTGLLHRQPR